ncbi:MAG: hypothetical protein LBF28_00470 [Rickettsiales bacterium]|jgi:hypothetical protein|nr:hypothetical protein [Rickettsiales bacterium]
MRFLRVFITFVLAFSGVVKEAPAAIVARSGISQPSNAIQSGTAITQRNVGGIVPNECSETYNGCMDQFCMIDNTGSGRCVCSNEATKLQKTLDNISSKTAAVERQSRETIKILESGETSHVRQTTERSSGRSAALMTMFAEKEEETAPECDGSVSCLAGARKYSAADELCKKTLPVDCSPHTQMLGMLYTQQIKSDCAAFSNSVAEAEKKSKEVQYQSSRSARTAARDVMQSQNKLDLGGCILETHKCMTGPDVCGKNWENCVSSGNVTEKGFSTGTVERLDINLLKCEYVQKQCQDVASQVAPAFINAFKEQIAAAEHAADSIPRMQCLANISDCIVKACRDDIEGKGVDTMDSCLSRPEMAQSFCKVQLDPCIAIEPRIWDFVKNRLAAMRVDACTDEVKQCLTSEDRCGDDWLACIGLDYESLHEMCPVDKLVVCKANNPSFSFSDLDKMIQGIYLGIDNAALDKCMELAENKMLEVCGSTNGCNAFDTDSDLGTSSLARDKSGNVVKISGLLNWTMVGWRGGQLLIEDYMDNVRATRAEYGARDRVQNALADVNAEISKTIELIKSSDPELSYCINGREMSQIRGRTGQTQARFPHMMDKYLPIIANAARAKASMNYARKYMEIKQEIIREADIMNAEYSCYAMPIQADQQMAAMGMVDNESNFETIKARGGQGPDNLFALAEIVADTVSTEEISKLAGQKITNKKQAGGVSVEYYVSAIFSRETRECRITTDSTICTAKEVHGDGTGQGLKQMLKSIAISCAIGAVTAGIGAVANSAKEAAVVADGTKKVADATDNLNNLKGIADATINTPSFMSFNPSNLSTTFQGTSKAVNVLESLSDVVKAGDTLKEVTTAAKAANATAKVASAARMANIVKGAAAAGAVVGAGISAANSDQPSVGSQIAWVAASAAAGAGAGALCGAIATAFPIGTIVAAAIVVVAAVASAVIDDTNYIFECEAMERQEEVIQM